MYVNSIKLRLPAVFATLAPADLLTISSNNGSPYTEDYSHLFDWIRPSAVRGYLS